MTADERASSLEMDMAMLKVCFEQLVRTAQRIYGDAEPHVSVVLHDLPLDAFEQPDAADLWQWREDRRHGVFVGSDDDHVFWAKHVEQISHDKHHSSLQFFTHDAPTVDVDHGPHPEDEARPTECYACWLDAARERSAA